MYNYLRDTHNNGIFLIQI